MCKPHLKGEDIPQNECNKWEGPPRAWQIYSSSLNVLSTGSDGVGKCNCSDNLVTCHVGLPKKRCNVCSTRNVIGCIVTFGINWSSQILFKGSPMYSMLLGVSNGEMTEALVTVRDPQSRNGRNWHTIWSYANTLLATIATCSSSRNQDSRRTSRFCMRSD